MTVSENLDSSSRDTNEDINNDGHHNKNNRMNKKSVQTNLRTNREGLKGWLNPSRYGWERVSYWLQRLTGVFLLVYFVGHVYETSSLVSGPDAWATMLEMTQTIWGHLFLMTVIGASTFHTINGIRLIFTHVGMGLGKPGRPDYPYDPTSINTKQRSGIWIALVLAAVAMLYGASVLFGGE